MECSTHSTEKHGIHDAAREKIPSTILVDVLLSFLFFPLSPFSSSPPSFLPSFLLSLSLSFVNPFSLPFSLVPQVLKWRKSQRHSTQRTYSYLQPLKPYTCGKVIVTVTLMLTLPSCSLPCLAQFYFIEPHYLILSSQSWWLSNRMCMCTSTDRTRSWWVVSNSHICSYRF